MKIRRRTVIVSTLILLGLTFLVIGILMQRPLPKFYAHSLRNWQEADATAGYPIATDQEGVFRTTEFEPNLSHLRSMERYQIPLTRFFTHPGGNLALPVKTSKWAVEFEAPGKEVLAAGNGLVLAVTKTRGYPDKVILIGHRLPNKKIVQTLYAGLTETTVRVGDRVAAGEKIGKRKDPLYFEVRRGSGLDLELEIVNGVTLNAPHSDTPFNRIDPIKFLNDSEPASPNAMALIRDKKTDPDRAFEVLQFDPESALKLHEFLKKKRGNQ